MSAATLGEVLTVPLRCAWSVGDLSRWMADPGRDPAIYEWELDLVTADPLRFLSVVPICRRCGAVGSSHRAHLDPPLAEPAIALLVERRLLVQRWTVATDPIVQLELARRSAETLAAWSPLELDGRRGET